MHHFKYSTRVVFVVIACTSSFLIVGLTPSNLQWLIYIGVCFASLCTSLGEITFLSMSTLYDRVLALSGWGSGTGAAGIGASLIYAALTSLAGLSPRTTILIMLFIPFLMAISFLCLPPHSKISTEASSEPREEVVINNQTETNPVNFKNREMKLNGKFL